MAGLLGNVQNMGLLDSMRPMRPINLSTLAVGNPYAIKPGSAQAQQMQHGSSYGQTTPQGNRAIAENAENKRKIAIQEEYYRLQAEDPERFAQLPPLPDLMREPSAWQGAMAPFTGPDTNQNASNAMTATLGSQFAGGLIPAAKQIQTKGIMSLLDPRMSGQLNTFAGTGAKTANKEAFALADAMKMAGATDDEILQATNKLGQPIRTGFPDGMPRFEIDDSGATTTFGRSLWDDQQAARLDDPDTYKAYQRYQNMPSSKIEGSAKIQANYADVKRRLGLEDDYFSVGANIKHDDLLSAYTDVGAEKFQRGIDGGGLGEYSEQGVKIARGLRGDEAKSTTLHELQHAIQQREGFARGGSPEGMSDAYDALRARLHFLEQDPGYIEASSKVDDAFEKVMRGELGEDQIRATEESVAKSYPAYGEARQVVRQLGTQKQGGYEGYKRLAGEAEARLVQSRMNLTADQRLAEPITHGSKYGFDVPEADQIVLRGDGVQQSLPTDEASRMAGAREMEMAPDDFYHGTTQDIEEFAPKYRPQEQLGFGTHITTDPSFANEYATGGAARKGDSPNVMPLKARLGNVLSADEIVKEGSEEFALAKKLAGRKFFPVKDENGVLAVYMQNAIDATNPKRAEKLLRDAGYDSVKYKSKITGRPMPGGQYSVGPQAESYTVLNPNQLRSKFAAFDPAKKDSANLMHGIGGLGAGGLMSQDEQKPRGLLDVR
jgi:hypothetical protein